MVTLTLFFVGEGVHASQVAAREWFALALFPTGVAVGLIVAWRREGLGGIVTVASLLGFYALYILTDGAPPSGWAWWMFAAPGVLFLLCWAASLSSRAHPHPSA